MHQKSATAIAPAPKAPLPASSSACPYTPPADTSSSSPSTKSSGILSKLNPLNYMFSDLSQKPAPNQSISLPTEREASTIPRGTGDGNWEYPSPQQMYNALLRKGYDDTDPTAIESMVSVHNFLNEGAWNEIVEWERRFANGLVRGWQECHRGEEGSLAGAEIGNTNVEDIPQPRLSRFQGRPKEMTPKAAMIQILGRVWPKYEYVVAFCCEALRRSVG